MKWASVLALVVLAVEVAAENIQVPQTATGPASQMEKLGPGKFRIGTALLDKTSPSSTTLRVPAKVNMREGMIELVACSSGGKLHESVFEADVEPIHLNVALLLMGLKPKGRPAFQGDRMTAQGDQVLIYVEQNGARRRVEDYVWDIPSSAPMPRTGWVFTDTKFINGEFGAQLTRTLITTQHDPYTILDNPLPGGVDSQQYQVNRRVTPPVGTSVTLVIQPLRTETAKGVEK